MSGDPFDLSGTWHGTYAYPSGVGPETPFLAIIEDQGGRIIGTIVEPDQIHGQGTLDAAIAGARSGSAVDFTKSYGTATKGYDNPVDYVGKLSGDGLTVSGVWSLLEFDGTFEMHRQAQAEEPRAIEKAVSLPAGASKDR